MEFVFTGRRIAQFGKNRLLVCVLSLSIYFVVLFVPHHAHVDASPSFGSVCDLAVSRFWLSTGLAFQLGR